MAQRNGTEERRRSTVVLDNRIFRYVKKLMNTPIPVILWDFIVTLYVYLATFFKISKKGFLSFGKFI